MKKGIIISFIACSVFQAMKSDIGNDTTEPPKNLCDAFVRDIVLLRRRKKLNASDDIVNDFNFEQEFFLFVEPEKWSEIEIEERTKESNSMNKRVQEKKNSLEIYRTAKLL